MNASEMSRRRASRRRRAATLTAQPSAVASAAAPSTSQKCACWFSQVTSTAWAGEQDREQDERRGDDGDQRAQAHSLDPAQPHFTLRLKPRPRERVTLNA